MMDLTKSVTKSVTKSESLLLQKKYLLFVKQPKLRKKLQSI